MMKKIALLTTVLVLALAGCALAEADKGPASSAAETAENEAEIFDALNRLEYHPHTCDGLPEYRLAAADGTVYWISFSGKWVWRKSKSQTEVSEAGLSEELISQLKENAVLTPTEYAGIETHPGPDGP